MPKTKHFYKVYIEFKDGTNCNHTIQDIEDFDVTGQYITVDTINDDYLIYNWDIVASVHVIGDEQ